MSDAAPLLSVRNLTIGFPGRAEPTVADISFDVAAGRVMAQGYENGRPATAVLELTA